jgi:copper(I)-binding protein
VRLLPTRHFTVLATFAVAGLIVGTSGLQEAGAATQATAPNIVARVGHLEIINPSLPEDQSSPLLAAIYLTVKNTGPKADSLVSVSSPISSNVMLMSGNGSSTSMVSALRIPAHGEAQLTPSRVHLMLGQPKVEFKVGKTVLVTLRFEHSGSVTLKVPIVRLH